MAGFLLCASKKGISTHQMHRMIGISYKSTWFMMHRLREARASQELYGKSYFSLGSSEKSALDQMVQVIVGGNFQAITPDLLRQTAPQAVGFQAPTKPSAA